MFDFRGSVDPWIIAPSSPVRAGCSTDALADWDMLRNCQQHAVLYSARQAGHYLSANTSLLSKPTLGHWLALNTILYLAYTFPCNESPSTRYRTEDETERPTASRKP